MLEKFLKTGLAGFLSEKKMINRREFLKYAGPGLAAVTLPGCLSLTKKNDADISKSKPNIIFILADDLGYGDLSCFESKDIHTPRLDALAKKGRTFKRFYSASAVCTPTRASVMTGCYPLRFDIRSHFKERPDLAPEYLPCDTLTIAKLLKGAGYATAHIGKWHLGGLQPEQVKARAKGDKTIPGPHEHGFEHYLAMYEYTNRQKLLKSRRLYRDGGSFLIRNDRSVEPIKRHWTDIKVDETLSLIEKYNQQQRPFFINLWFDVPHTPYEPAPQPHLGKYKNIASGDDLLYRSMVSHMDANIGRIVDKLKTMDIFENTLILFTSDNGPSFQGSPGPWKGGKADLHEGGIREPMFAVWPGHIPADTISDELAHTNDILPTVCAAAGVKLPANAKIDGVNILDNLTQGKPIERSWPVFWQLDLYKWYPQPGDKPKPYATEIARDKRWKLLAFDGRGVELFDLEKDPKETTNVMKHYPEIVRKLQASLQKWLNEPRHSCSYALKKTRKIN
jgi:N-acetylgalactosamine-6-sulfatase